ncbi:thiol-disulfide isomerase/thioredoxin [Larkinella arboricola]|uniref:Thiol-disulfide isomerase/thioredoxin n=1 Tax=Larkinella arboricola TaxID=643671 RepID=A0A327WLI7_LARAB|nr:TlpA disulfide reductase family protein [Larkinella arboricola]RAJ91121.1 thiol-disulfide isomerase/thioredoxin [Larkinella arboricola]
MTSLLHKTIQLGTHLLLCGWFCSTGLSQVVAPQSFSLQGHLSTLKKGNVYLLRQDKVPLDSTAIAGNHFTFRGKLAEPGLHFLQIGKDERTYPVFLEGASMQIRFHNDQTYQVTGSPLHVQWDEYENKFLNGARDKLVALFSQQQVAQQQGDSVRLMALRKQNDTLSVAIGRQLLDRLTRKPYTFFNLYLLKERSYSDEFITNQLNEFRPVLSGYPSFQNLEKGLKEKQQLLKKIAPGQVAYAFELPDSSGKAHSLASLANKVVLIDFWASWCGPCIQQMPSLKALQAAFGAQGLTIIGISIDDDRQRWLQALRRLRPAGIQLLASKDQVLKEQYALFAIPQTYLIDQDGKIIATNLEKEALREKVAELLTRQR